MQKTFRLIFAPLLLFVVACEQEDIRVYRAPKDSQAAAVERVAGPGVGAAHSERRAMQWQAPSRWRLVAGEEAMRVATYVAGEDEGELEVAVSAFSGMAGGVVANINRWRDQAGLGPIEPDELAEHAEHFHGQTVHGWTMRIRPSHEGREGMFGAVIEGDPQRTWFVRATGTAAQLDEHEQELVGFARSFVYGPRSGGGGHQGHGGLSMVHIGEHPHWQLPDGWITQANDSSVVFAMLRTGSDERDALLTVTPMLGEGGGLLANINMWRGQIGLEPIQSLKEQSLDRVEVDGSDGWKLQMHSPSHGGVSSVVVIVPRGEYRWFLRMIGPSEVVASQRESFNEFIESIYFTSHD